MLEFWIFSIGSNLFGASSLATPPNLPALPGTDRSWVRACLPALLCVPPAEPAPDWLPRSLRASAG